MADALSEALQKLSIARTQTHSEGPSVGNTVATQVQNDVADSVPAEVLTASESAAVELESIASIKTTPSECASSSAIVHESPTVSAGGEVPRHEPSARLFFPQEEPGSQVSAESNGSSEATATVETKVSAEAIPVPASVSNSTFIPTPAWRRAVAYLLDNRRHAAAIVVLVCMGFFWFDDSSAVSPSGDGSGALVEDFSDVEAALSEFDVQSAPPLKEPAEPVDVSSGFDLTIPAGDMATANKDSGSSEPGSVAAYPDSPGSLEIPQANTYGGSGNMHSGNAWPGVPASAVSAPEGSGRSVKARLSRSIEPIN